MSQISFRKAPSALLAFAASLVLIAVGTPQLSAQTATSSDAADRTHIEEILRGLNRGRGFGQVGISPDGSKIAWIEGGRGGGEIRVASPRDLGRTERVTAATNPEQRCREGEFTWAPDSKGLAFFSDCGNSANHQVDLYLSHLDGTPAKRLTALKGLPQAPAFSPDGSQIAFLYVEGATRPAGALAAMKPPSGVIGEDGVEVQRVAVARIDIEAAQPTIVSPPNLHVYEFDWSPDSKSMAYIAAEPPGENNWWVAKLYTQSLNGQPKPILAPETVSGPLHGLQIAVPRWSPDGKTIAFIGGLMSDQGFTGGDVWIVSSDGGQPRDLTQGRPTSPAWISGAAMTTCLSANSRAATVSSSATSSAEIAPATVPSPSVLPSSRSPAALAMAAWR